MSPNQESAEAVSPALGAGRARPGAATSAWWQCEMGESCSFISGPLLNPCSTSEALVKCNVLEQQHRKKLCLL